MKMAVYASTAVLVDPANPMQVHRLSARGNYSPAQLLALLTPYVND